MSFEYVHLLSIVRLSSSSTLPLSTHNVIPAQLTLPAVCAPRPVPRAAAAS